MGAGWARATAVDRALGAGPTTVADPGVLDRPRETPGGGEGAEVGPTPTAAAASTRPRPHAAQVTAVFSNCCTASSRPKPLARNNAITPDTWAADIDVPAMVAYMFPG